MNHLIYSFLKQYWDGHSPLLLALSGGPDSLALFHLLAEEKRLKPKIGIAHIDHGWRDCSHHESQQLQILAKTYHMPFHLKVLQPKLLEGNLEDACRKERLQFFRTLVKEFGYQAVLLGHHADDQAETVFKKIFENVSLPELHGLQKESSHAGLKLWRPFLSVRKQDIMAFLNERQLTAFDDYTNRDTRFLRARLRESLLPHLSQQFGKEINSSLCRLSAEAWELKQYLQKNICPYLLHIEESSLGLMLDLSKKCPTENIELKYLIRLFCKQAKFALNRTLLETVAAFITSGQANKKVQVHHKQLFIDRRRLFIPKERLDTPTQICPLPLGYFSYGMWQGLLSESVVPAPPTSWQQAWQGYISTSLPFGNYGLGPAQACLPYLGSSPISKWWNTCKIPAFLRHHVPVVYELDASNTPTRLAHELLTGHAAFSFQGEEKVLNLVLNRKA